MLLYFCTFWKMDLIIRNFLNDNKQFFIFFQKKAFLIFRKIETPKKFLIFQEMGPSYILGNGIPKNWGGNSSSSKWKKTPLKCFLYFEKTDIYSYKLKNLLYFKRELPKAWKTNKSSCFEGLSCHLWHFFNKIVRHREIPCEVRTMEGIRGAAGLLLFFPLR